MAIKCVDEADYTKATVKRLDNIADGQTVSLYTLPLVQYVINMHKLHWYAVLAKTDGFRDPSEPTGNVVLYDATSKKWMSDPKPLDRTLTHSWPGHPASLLFVDPDDAAKPKVGVLLVSERQLEAWGVGSNIALRDHKWPELGGKPDDEPEDLTLRFLHEFITDAGIAKLLKRSPGGRKLLDVAKALPLLRGGRP